MDSRTAPNAPRPSHSQRTAPPAPSLSFTADRAACPVPLIHSGPRLPHPSHLQDGKLDEHPAALVMAGGEDLDFHGAFDTVTASDCF